LLCQDLINRVCSREFGWGARSCQEASKERGLHGRHQLLSKPCANGSELGLRGCCKRQSNNNLVFVPATRGDIQVGMGHTQCSSNGSEVHSRVRALHMLPIIKATPQAAVGQAFCRFAPGFRCSSKCPALARSRIWGRISGACDRDQICGRPQREGPSCRDRPAQMRLLGSFITLTISMPGSRNRTSDLLTDSSRCPAGQLTGIFRSALAETDEGRELCKIRSKRRSCLLNAWVRIESIEN
jgi:hypothetical protein